MVTEKRISRMKRTFFIDNVKNVFVINTANSVWNKHPYQKLLHFVMFYTIGKLFPVTFRPRSTRFKVGSDLY